MSYEEPERTPPTVDWLAESMRSANFPTPGIEFDPAAWWHGLLDRAPDMRTVRPNVKEWKEEGEFAGGKLRLETSWAAVIQWFLSPPPIKEVPDEFPTLGRFGDTCEAFHALVRRWVEQFAPPLDRIAFGVTAIIPVSERIEGYRLLSQYLHAVRVDVEGSGDLLYQINRRRPSRSGVKGLEINRLAKWSVMQMHVLARAVSAPGSEVRPLPAVNACRVELDASQAFGRRSCRTLGRR